MLIGFASRGSAEKLKSSCLYTTFYSPILDTSRSLLERSCGFLIRTPKIVWELEPGPTLRCHLMSRSSITAPTPPLLFFAEGLRNVGPGHRNELRSAPLGCSAYSQKGKSPAGTKYYWRAQAFRSGKPLQVEYYLNLWVKKMLLDSSCRPSPYR